MNAILFLGELATAGMSLAFSVGRTLDPPLKLGVQSGNTSGIPVIFGGIPRFGRQGQEYGSSRRKTADLRLYTVVKLNYCLEEIN